MYNLGTDCVVYSVLGLCVQSGHGVLYFNVLGFFILPGKVACRRCVVYFNFCVQSGHAVSSTNKRNSRPAKFQKFRCVRDIIFAGRRTTSGNPDNACMNQ